MDYTKLKKSVIKKNKKYLKFQRKNHVKRVAKLASQIAITHGMDPQKAEIAGLAHDMARNWPKQKVLRYIESCNFPLSKEEGDNPYMLHGLAAALILRNQLGCKDEKIFEALRYHTTGRAYMSKLAKLLFIADYIEPGRSYISGKWRKKLLNKSLDTMLEKVTKRMIKHQAEKRKATHPWTEELYKEIMRHE
ncbi:MAG: bis(5'-nucleosyl)-tetraphosphatase (symmetrical) YqeK [Spirochaetaceae bacterium]|nr:bis(5'-nucleosyl)-tetraphosphatase (symmetrical) YqeK [Spirochaetaceae bacterium]